MAQRSGQGSDCWLEETIRGSDGKSAPNGVHKNQKDCKVDIARGTDFVIPITKGLGSGGIEIQRCQGSDPQHRSCKLTGTLSIYRARRSVKRLGAGKAPPTGRARLAKKKQTSTLLISSCGFLGDIERRGLPPPPLCFIPRNRPKGGRNSQ